MERFYARWNAGYDFLSTFSHGQNPHVVPVFQCSRLKHTAAPWKLALDNIKKYAKKAYAGVVHNEHLVGHTPAEEEAEGDYVRLRLFKAGDKNVKFTGNSTKSARDNFSDEIYRIICNWKIMILTKRYATGKSLLRMHRMNVMSRNIHRNNPKRSGHDPASQCVAGLCLGGASTI